MMLESIRLPGPGYVLVLPNASDLLLLPCERDLG